jgi:hypothetical protein
VGQVLAGQIANGGAIFGQAIALNRNDGTILAVGDPSNNSNFAGSGSVTTYQLVAGDWQQQGSVLNGQDVGHDFGRSLALSSDGTILAVGALFLDFYDQFGSGRV